MTLTQQTATQLIDDVEASIPWLLELDEACVRHKPTPDRWSIVEVIGHLVDSACNNYQRFIRAQQVEAFSFPGYQQNHWVAAGNYQQAEWGELVEFWRLHNHQIARVMRSMPEEKLEMVCEIAPSEPCTLGFLVSDYVVHLNHHLDKIRERVGRESAQAR